MTLVEERGRFAAGLAGHLVDALEGPAGCQGLPERVSRHFAYRADDERLFVVAGPQEAARPATLDLALAYGLSYARDRDLTVVLPAGGAEATVRRAAWLDVPVRVVEYDPADPAPDPRPRALPARAVVLEGLRGRPLVPLPAPAAPARLASAGRLAAWADGHPLLRPAHRNGYRAWHCRGRSVLRIATGATGVVIQAGVDGTDGGPRFPAPLELHVTDELAPDQLERVCRAVEAAVDQRLTGADQRPSEHWFQAVLRDAPEVLGLRRGNVLRELPAFRPEAGTALRRGFADLVGVTREGRIAVVETKLGADPMLVLQGLDYWTWATAHRKELATRLGLDPAGEPEVELVLGVDARDGSPRIGRHLAAQAQALAGAVRWRIVAVEDWFAERPRAIRLPARTLPPEHPAAQARRSLVGRGLLHAMDAHLRSSQRFAVNLFGPLPAAAVARLLARLFGDTPVDVDPVALEFADPHDRLRERRPASPHQTQVDVLLRGIGGDGRRLAALVEVKLSERDFGHCSGYQSRRNPARDVCLDGGPFGGQPARCHQLRGNGPAEPRAYDRYLGPVGPLSGHTGCLFRLGLNQPMRNLALARAMLADREVDQVAYVLCAHDDNGPIWRRWAEAARVFGGDPTVRLDGMPASQVVALHQPDDAAWLRHHYALP
jgi:hypothetical protein